MSPLEIEMYEINSLSESNEKHQEFIKLFNKCKKQDSDKIVTVANFVKEYLVKNEKWKYKKSKKKRKTKIQNVSGKFVRY